MTLEDIQKYCNHYSKSEQLVKILGANKTSDDTFFRTLVAYYFN